MVGGGVRVLCKVKVKGVIQMWVGGGEYSIIYRFFEAVGGRCWVVFGYC